MSPPHTVHAVVPGGIDDARRPSGGNRYDRRVLGGLTGLGWSVHEHPVPGRWPDPGPPALTLLADMLDDLPLGALVLLDGLVASAAADLVATAAGRLRTVVLVHLPLGVSTPARRPAEGAMLTAVSAVVATSGWTSRWLVDAYGMDPARVYVAVPGAEAAPLSRGTPGGGRLLSVGAVTPVKGYDVLLAGLAGLDAGDWRCSCVGSLDVDPGFVRDLRRQADEAGITDRFRLTGALTSGRLAGCYAAADLLVLASRTESFGMVVTESLARGIPVVATEVGGLPEALGRTIDGARPGCLVPASDPAALAAVLDRWLADPAERGRLRGLARERRRTLTGWEQTVRLVAGALCGPAGNPPAIDIAPEA